MNHKVHIESETVIISNYHVFSELSPSIPNYPRLSRTIPNYPVYPELSPSIPNYPRLYPTITVYTQLSPSIPLSLFRSAYIATLLPTTPQGSIEAIDSRRISTYYLFCYYH